MPKMQEDMPPQNQPLTQTTAKLLRPGDVTTNSPKRTAEDIAIEVRAAVRHLNMLLDEGRAAGLVFRHKATDSVVSKAVFAEGIRISCMIEKDI